MLKPTFIAAATALVIAAGSLGAMTTTASAQNYGGPGWHHNGPGGPAGPGGPGWNRGPGPGPGPGWHRGRQMCRPVVRSVKVRGYHGWHWEKRVVGQKCAWGGPGRW